MTHFNHFSLASKKQNNISPEKIQHYEKLVQFIPGMELKGAAMPYTSHNGHMFSFMNKDGELALRLQVDLLAEFIKKFNTSMCEAHGAVLKEYVSVPEKILKETTLLKKYFTESYKYVSSLKPKTKKK